MNRDPLRALIYTTSTAGILSLLIGDFSGGTLVYILAEQAINSSYSREVEAKADAYSIDLLKRNHIDLNGFAEFFEFLEEFEEDLPEALAYISTHPASHERRMIIKEAAERQETTEEILPQSDWQALKSICD